MPLQEAICPTRLPSQKRCTPAASPVQAINLTTQAGTRFRTLPKSPPTWAACRDRRRLGPVRPAAPGRLLWGAPPRACKHTAAACESSGQNHRPSRPVLQVLGLGQVSGRSPQAVTAGWRLLLCCPAHRGRLKARCAAGVGLQRL